MPDARDRRADRAQASTRRAGATITLAAALLSGIGAVAGVAAAEQDTAGDDIAMPAADAALAADVLEAANRYRATRGLPGLQPSADLAALAAGHSAHMARLGRLTHAGFAQRFDRARRQTCVENLAAGFRRAAPLVAAWQVSPDHHRNLLDARVQEVGVASIAGHVTWLACSARTASAASAAR